MEQKIYIYLEDENYPMEEIDTSSNFLVIFLSINNQPTPTKTKEGIFFR